MKTKNTFQTPDFAFPKTVAENAVQQYESAMKSGDMELALRAAIQQTIAGSLVTSDSYSEAISRFEQIGSRAPAPYGSLAQLLEARIYADIYEDDRWQYNERILPSEPVPADVKAWSREMFENKVTSLVSGAMAAIDTCAAMPLKAIEPLLADAGDAIAAHFSVADFMTLRALDLLDTFRADSNDLLPFRAAGQNQPESSATPSPTITSSDLLDAAIARHEKDGDLFLLSYFCNLKLTELKQGSGISARSAARSWLQHCQELFGETPYDAPFLVSYAEDRYPDDLRKRYELYTDYLRRFPDAYNAGAIQSAVNNMLAKEVEVRFDEKVLPGQPWKVRLCASNIHDLYLLVYKLPDRGGKETGLKYADLKTQGKLLHAIRVQSEGDTPDSFERDIEMPGLNPGDYTVVASSTPDAKGFLQKWTRNIVNTLLVSDLTLVTSDNGDGTRNLYVVSAVNQRPVKGATVSLWRDNYRERTLLKTVTSDSDGCVRLPEESLYCIATYGGSRAEDYTYRAYSHRSQDPEIRNKVLTDLGIYRPGDKVQFAVITYIEYAGQLMPAPGIEVKATLRDANWQESGHLTLTTDSLGRTTGEFTLPQQGLLGRWAIVAEGGGPESDTYFEVAEYKAPTFHAELKSDTSLDSFKIGDILKFRGSAGTYSGMPVANAKVTYTIRYRPVWWWGWNLGSNASYGGETRTADDGSFSIELDTEGLRDTDYATGRFTLQVSVTDAAGETVTAPALSFSTGKAFEIKSAIDGKANISNGELSGSVRVFDMAMQPVQTKVYYELRQGEETVKKGSFETPALSIDVKDVPSGRYELRLSLNPDIKDDETSRVLTDPVTLWRDSDKRPAATTPLWLPEENITATAGARSVKVRVGSSYPDSWVLAQFCTDSVVTSTRWLQINDGIIELPVDVPDKWHNAYVNFTAVRDWKVESGRVTIVPAERLESLDIASETFRDNIEPGTRESWRFRFNVAGQAAGHLPVMAVMSNKALNALAPFRWQFNPFGMLSFSPAGALSADMTGQACNSVHIAHEGKRYKHQSFSLPMWQTYGYPLYAESRPMYGGIMYMNAASGGITRNLKASVKETDASAPMVAADCSSENAPTMMRDMADSEEAASETAVAEVPEDAEVRDIECPLAFFMGDLMTDSNGLATLSFTAPAFVGTWQLQVLGYTSDMKGQVLTLDVVSAKKVMAQLNAPRFLRTGDKATISATLYNNSDSETRISGDFYVIDAVTGKVLLNLNAGSGMVAPSGSMAVSVEFDVPTGVNSLIIRAYASGGSHIDGEQALVPVLPSSTPVTEAVPFYLAAGEKEFSLRVPKLDADANVTLNYCDNPIWECVTALPALLEDQSANTLNRAWALYGNALAASLFDKYPQLMAGIRCMQADTTSQSMQSPLSRGEDVKNFLLNSTPWVNDAQSETLRMQSLLEYGNREKAASAVRSAMSDLAARQNADGGWSWCPDGKSSPFITGCVMLWLSPLAELGCLPDGAHEVAVKAFRYLDNEFAKDWEASHRKWLPVQRLIDYINAKAAFGNIGSTTAFKPLEAAALKQAQSDWRNLGIYDKATAAMLFERKGKKELARTLLASLHEYMSESRERGAWFDNANGLFISDSPLLATARVLQAYAMIEPGSPVVDKLRQWLVVSKQTQNWGDMRCTAEAIYALLTSGSDWTEVARSPKVTLDGKLLDLGHIASMTGAVTVNLDAKSASNAELAIERYGAGPAWGGVISRYVAPIADVQADKIPELSIEKNIYVVTGTEDGAKATEGRLQVGDKVRVTLTLVCDRDLEYVAVGDSRSACLEPVDQLSGYAESDGVWFYREVRNESTNLFIDYLAKGTHVISYECTVDRAGEYSLGIASAQSQYAPTIAAHSAGRVIRVE